MGQVSNQQAARQTANGCGVIGTCVLLACIPGIGIFLALGYYAFCMAKSGNL